MTCPSRSLISAPFDMPRDLLLVFYDNLMNQRPKRGLWHRDYSSVTCFNILISNVTNSLWCMSAA